ncbi:unnamed protein product, partial [Ectocarpus sp. 12 AP-2014]
MLQKNIRRGRAEAAVRCALELALKSWSDAIRRVLVIIVEDSLLHPAAPFLTWLMVATSKGYRPPPRLLEAFLCVVHETAACHVRDSTDSSCRHRRGAAAAAAATITNAAIAVANIRRALLMRMSYGGMACDQALLKGVCLAWGER